MLALLLGPCVLSCDTPLAPPDGTPFVPPPSFRSLWRTVEACGGRTGDLEAISWFVTEGSAGAGGSGDVAGSWWPEGNRIYITEAFIDDESVVRHEMLHALLRGQRHETAFLVSCGDLVTCVGDCITEAGGLTSLPGPAAPLVSPDELDVEVTILPPLAGEGGWTTVIVSARNTRDEAVWVDLSGRPEIQFECLVDGFHCGVHYFGDEVRAPFRAGETRREATVFPQLPGTYQVVGSFNTKQAAPGVLVVP